MCQGKSETSLIEEILRVMQPSLKHPPRNNSNKWPKDCKNYSNHAAVCSNTLTLVKYPPKKWKRILRKIRNPHHMDPNKRISLKKNQCDTPPLICKGLPSNLQPPQTRLCLIPLSLPLQKSLLKIRTCYRRTMAHRQHPLILTAKKMVTIWNLSVM